MKIIIPLALATLTVSTSLADPIKAFTEDGREVSLFENGTWVPKPDRPENTQDPAVRVQTSSSATMKLTNRRGSYTIWYDPNVWKRSEADEDGDIEFFLQMKDEDAYAMTIYERIPVPLANLRELVLENMKNASTSMRIADEKMVNVNGERLMFLQLDAIVEGMPFVYRGYYASGDYGTIQFLTFTHRNFIGEYKEAMDSLLSGLRVKSEK